jgi:hypothetical protein
VKIDILKKFCTLLSKNEKRIEEKEVEVENNVYTLAQVDRDSWTILGSNPGGGEIFRTHPDWPWDHPASCKMGTGSPSRG